MSIKFNKRVLIFPGGTEVGLEIARSLRYCKEVEVYSAASGVKQHAPFVYEDHHEVPSISDPACLQALNNLISEWGIDCIFPANPLVIDFLNRHRDQISAVLITSDSEVLSITRSKTATYERMKNYLAVPRIYTEINADDKFPIFIKPDAMYGSQGARSVNSYSEYLACPPDPSEVVCEYLPGIEYTVDCFSNRHNELLFVGPRTRERIRMGTSMHSETPPEDTQVLLRDMAAIIQTHLKMRGAWFFQAKYAADGTLKLLEVESRIAGTMALHRVQGVNFALLSILDAYEINVSIKTLKANVIIDRALTNRYFHNVCFDTVYVDLDDTIIVKGRLNLQMIRFLYQCINKNQKIVLLSKSLEADPVKHLQRWRILNIFDDIYWLTESDSKARFITNKHSIFIDDSFTQRMEVERELGIPTFDPSMVELLIDERW